MGLDMDVFIEYNIAKEGEPDKWVLDTNYNRYDGDGDMKTLGTITGRNTDFYRHLMYRYDNIANNFEVYNISNYLKDIFRYDHPNGYIGILGLYDYKKEIMEFDLYDEMVNMSLSAYLFNSCDVEHKIPYIDEYSMLFKYTFAMKDHIECPVRFVIRIT
jgi:hypothetical protein